MKLIKLMLTIIILLLLTACGSKEEIDSEPENLELEIVYMKDWGSKKISIIQDQLSVLGITLKLTQAPNLETYINKVSNGEFDIAFSPWNTVTGNPDYAVRSLFTPKGDFNLSKLDDDIVTELIEKASTETPIQYVKTYGELEQYMMDKAYIVPLYSKNKAQAYNKELLLENSRIVRFPKSRALVWEKFDYKDASLRNIKSLVLTQNSENLTSLDPIKANDESINMINTNMYIRLINLTDDDSITSEGSLSYSHAISDGNENYYFVLRDDVNFATLEDNKIIDTGELVSGEDVVFSLKRASNKYSVVGHRTYSLHENIETVSLVTDINELSTVKSNSGETIKEILEKELKKDILLLALNELDVENRIGIYQVVKINTVKPFPQMLNFLAHQSAGIVSKVHVSEINGEGGSYGYKNDVINDHHLYTSGPYSLVSKTEDNIEFKRNPNYMIGTEHEPRIENIELKILQDAEQMIKAVLDGEVHILESVSSLYIKRLESNESIEVVERSSNSTSFLLFNLDEEKGSAVLNENLRKAILYSIKQRPLIDIIESGHATEITTTVTPLIKYLEGYKHIRKPEDIEKAKEYFDLYKKRR